MPDVDQNAKKYLLLSVVELVQQMGEMKEEETLSVLVENLRCLCSWIHLDGFSESGKKFELF